jgi:hypothetical protein
MRTASNGAVLINMVTTISCLEGLIAKKITVFKARAGAQFDRLGCSSKEPVVERQILWHYHVATVAMGNVLGQSRLSPTDTIVHLPSDSRLGYRDGGPMLRWKSATCRGPLVGGVWFRRSLEALDTRLLPLMAQKTAIY